MKSLLHILCFFVSCNCGSVTSTISNAEMSTLHQQEELLKGLRVLYPESNVQYKSPMAFRFQLIALDFSELMTAYTGLRWLCLQLDGVWRRCIPIESGALIVESMAVGNHSARLAMFNASTPDTGTLLLQSEDVPFMILSEEDFAAVLEQQRRDVQALNECEDRKVDLNVVEWFRSKQNEENHGSREIDAATAYEQKVYGRDLLTDALNCEDSYTTLPQKVKEFLHFVGTDHVLRRAAYVMIADEDVYLRIGDIAQQLTALGALSDLYAGNVKEGNTFRPERDPERRYYLPESVYPLDEFPPFAWGPHYLMSMDVVEFIADNREELQGLGPLDDVTIALWLLAIQVHPQHLPQFQNLRETPCTNDLLAYADLGPSAIRIIHSNLQSGRDFCYGFNVHSWDKDNTL
ncbi:hypothetical protein PHMEG_00028567 [Phytophthora megakarya]|uniref:Hexosyltransferase n=1 Tax=Phytophthora megakarya TaxID=4795 RepID=A0A225V472_9STRA|nr:hypothetical protein PHMEG_00028567 [Phytophthora megakarya]